MDPNLLVAIIAVLVAIVAIRVAILIANKQSEENSIATQATLLSSILGSINDYHTKLIEAQDKGQREQFKEVLLNEMEFYALMVNRGIIKDDKLSSFFNEGYCEMYVELEVHNCATEHTEMKTLYDKLSKHF